MQFVPIKDYAWDQDKPGLIKVYLLKNLEGIGSHDKEAIQCTFEADTVDLKIRGFKNKNMRFLVKPLSYHVVPASCRIQVKSSSITITLKKEDQKHWVNLAMKSGPSLGGKTEESNDFKNDDPQASLMKMMKNLYDTGDDDMKRTITESFAKARTGDIPGPGGAAGGGMPPGI